MSREELKASFPLWLTGWMEAQKINLWGAADLRGFSAPPDSNGDCFPFAISFALSMDAYIMISIRNSPNKRYADEYTRVNNLIDKLSEALADKIRGRGFQAKPLPASERTDSAAIKGEFPHKTAATRAGLGWIGRHCQLITNAYGPWVRLGTVFTDLELPCGPPAGRNFCGSCTRCVEACPAKALKGNAWFPGIPREELLDFTACDEWKKEHYFKYNKGHNCGICSSVCPYGLATLKRYIAL
jgi:epoxyqueuosine reductase